MAKYELNYEVLDEDDKKKSTDNAEELLSWVETLIFTCFVFILIFTFLLGYTCVDGDSMFPTLSDGDRLIISHIGYTPKNGDIIIADCDLLDKIIVKRVIAVAGQTVDINFDTGSVKVDGVELKEDAYINALTKLDEGAHNYPVTVPENCVFVMGDNRMESTDSRSELVGFVSVDDVLGKVVFRIFPFSQIGAPAVLVA